VNQNPICGLPLAAVAGDDLATAAPGTLALMPSDGMLANLRTDYAAMAGMIFGRIPEFDEIATSIGTFEDRINNVQKNEV
jgi:hypothetical protein